MDGETRRVLGLLSQDDTLRVLAALVLTGDAGTAGLGEQPVERALDRLRRGGLAEPDGDGWRARPERFAELLRATAGDASGPLSPEERVLRNFLVDGRLREIPSRREKRLVILHHIVTLFEPGRRYPEKEVNVYLRAFHHDHAALRRYLIDEGLLSREDAVYWRSGGPVEV
ncbi:DUF2087 domain-containing protein [Spongiactinospora sp. TRM90649]|uniref:DUF2087 domain-containing protein n=1 Tax=Spongiactinospora sp. TRM90649 TaxID=3031114 RepID=UPI0023F811A1|nr:DUF2087 domain-containing protein [Spongiactinospora sp. TRM90649]MDF5757103.1 DUF2087 domain-containing protein [Spongiactinospora sp. TRM90649]